MSDVNNDGEPDPIAVRNNNLVLERDMYKRKFEEIKADYDKLVEAHERALKIIDSENRAIATNYLLEATTLTADDIAKIPTDELFEKIEAYEILKSPVASVRGIDSPLSKNRGLTLGEWDAKNKRWVT